MEIRRLQKADLDTRVEWMNHPDTYSSMHYATPVLLGNTLRWFEAAAVNDSRADLVIMGGGKISAFGGITGIDKSIKCGELYVFVNPNGHAHGIGTEATRLICKYGFEQLGLNKIFLKTNEDNYAAQRVYEKVGFLLEGVLREEYLCGDELKSRLYFGLLRKEFRVKRE